jgi:serine/threonine protein kinase
MPASNQAPFCIASPRFFDVPERIPDADTWFAAARRPAPEGWQRDQVGLSISLRPVSHVLPDQGWKIHIASTLDDTELVIDVAHDFCLAHRIPFKFIRSRAAALAVNSKYWPRNASGKIVVVYPSDPEQLTLTLKQLGAQLRAFTGPYILSDLRYGDGPLFVRYGAFKQIWHRLADGSRVPGIRRPDGETTPDLRHTTFKVPDFVEIPAVIRPFIDEPPGHSDDFPYTLERALHFSNGGGVYLARSDSTGGPVVLREGRPHAGLDGRGRDAVARLRNERDILRAIDGLRCAPRLFEYFTAWEHEFLAVEYIAGRTLLDEIISRYPLVHPEPTDDALSEYTAWVAAMSEKLADAVGHIHSRGVAVSDLHPSNILIGDDGELVIVDFETSRFIDDSSKPGLGAPGFAAPEHFSAEQADRYAMSRVRLMAWLPIVPVIALAPEKTATLVAAAADILPMPGETRTGLLDALEAADAGRPAADRGSELFASGDWPGIRRQLVDGILASASPDRRDRLFPGDPLQFSFGGATLAYGAAGVLMALAAAGEQVPEHLVRWLRDAVRTPGACAGSGLYDGSHGIAYVLDLLGDREAALDVLHRAPRPDPDGRWDLFGGAAGITLNCLHFGRIADDEQLREAALRTGWQVAERILSGRAPGTVRAGLFEGLTGTALMCLHLFDETGHDAYLDAAERALRTDLSSGEQLPDGTFHLRSAHRRLAYLDGGSSGVALVLARYLQRREDDELSTTLAAIHRACQIPFVLHPGLFQGRAGLVAALSDAASDGRCERDAVLTQVRRMGWHAISDGVGLVFPGSGLIRLSTDLATGSAGVLTTLVTVYQQVPISLPHLTSAC